MTRRNFVPRPIRIEENDSATTTGQGILGCMKQQIFFNMLDYVSGNHKVLICDKAGIAIISACFRIHELMDHGVTLLEDLFMNRQPLISLPALYFIAAENSSINRMLQDWTSKDMYAEAHVFFTGIAPDYLFELITHQQHFVQKVNTFRDMMLDFLVPETLLFHMGFSVEIPRLFPLDGTLSGDCELLLDKIALQLASVFYTIGCGTPVVRYQSNSQLAHRAAQTFCNKLAQLSRDVKNFNISRTVSEAPLFILVDRSYDVIAPLIHEQTYQCLLNDLLPLTNNVYVQKCIVQSGEVKEQLCTIDEHDPFWCYYRHKHFADCLEELPQQLKELLDEHPLLASGMTDGMSISVLGSAIRELPEFQEKKTKLSTHIDVCSKIMDQYKQQGLVKVCEVEQDLVTKRRHFKEVFETVRQLVGDVSIPVHIRLRLLLFTIATANTHEFTAVKRQQLFQECGFVQDADHYARLSAMMGNSVHIPLINTRSYGANIPSKANNVNLPASLHQHSTQWRHMPPQHGQQQFAAPFESNKGTKSGENFRNQAYRILDAAANDSLSLIDFPIINAVFRDSNRHMTTVPTGGATRRTLRASLARMHTSESPPVQQSAHVTTTTLPLEGGKTMLNLGYGGESLVNGTPRIVLFVVGGVTYGEARAAYEVSHMNFREVIVGGTSILNPENFVASLVSS